ncbi:radical SAM protein [Prochlorococcus sp. MIT 1306]|uniref:radical SAM protein n=1 Tax=Prochlorococcus sp. MIT 1306 TaxID=1799667 RepID=UPI0007B3BF20|nr:radical SAM protein [Prochlorococcus sp. MIT 1306]
MDQLETASQKGSKEFRRILDMQFANSPPVLTHHRVTKDVYFWVIDWINTTQQIFDPFVLFQDIREFGESQFYGLVAEAKWAINDEQSARVAAQQALDFDPFYAPAHNLMNIMDGVDVENVGNKFICCQPFTQMELKTIAGRDQFTFCCLQWSPYLITGLDLHKDEDIWNSEGAREFRKSILDGNYKYCNKRICTLYNNPIHNMVTREETRATSTLTSTSIKPTKLSPKRLIQSDFMRKQTQKVDPYFVDRPRHIFIAYDESCNLACPSCRKGIKRVSEKKRIEMDDLFESHVRPLLINGKTHLTASGHGDPIGSPHLRNKLKSIVGIEYSGVKINLQTNGQLLDEYGWNELSNILTKIADIRISIDAATKETYEVVRFPGNWEKLLANLDLTKQYKKKHGFRFIINFCIQSFNFNEIMQFAELGQQYGVDKVNFQQLINWGTYSSEDYKNRNIADVNHVRHDDFKQLLTHTFYKYPNIQLSSGLRRFLNR